MKVAVFGKQFGEIFFDECIEFFNILKNYQAEVIVFKPFYEFLLGKVNLKPYSQGVFEDSTQLTNIDLMFSLGGDGTFLETVTFVRDLEIPIVGINSGRLGFLAGIAKEEIPAALSDIFEGRYAVKELDLLELKTANGLFGSLNFALNELAIHKRDSSSMITIHSFVDEEYLNSYWADGLIIATPTGSTAYSLSVGGPIIHPCSNNFVVTPIAPHNLTVRPLVVPNDVEITLKVEGRDAHFLASLDSRSKVFDESLELRVKKADFKVRVVEQRGASFYSTLRNKMMWGADKRN